jgi:signal transduction histidine kinase
LLLASGVVLGVAAEWAALRPDALDSAGSNAHALAAGDFVAGLSLIACGIACRSRYPENRIGTLLTAAGYAWFLGTFSGASFDPASDAGALFVTLHRGPLAHALLAYPAGRLPRVYERGLATLLYAWAAVPDAGSSPSLTLAAAGLLVLGLAGSFRVAGGPRRRARAAALLAGLALSAVLAVGSLATLAHSGDPVNRAVLGAYQWVVAAVAVGLALDLLRRGWTRATVAGLVVELGRLPEATTLRARLAAALGDPSLTLGYRIGGGYVDEAGRPVEAPAAGSGRELTVVRDGDAPIAALVHDGGTLEDPELLESVAEAARIALSNVRLQHEIRRQVAEVDASRRRILESAELQRRRLERQLREGAERRLAEVEDILAAVECDGEALGTLDESRAELARARAELRELAHGILPELLTRHGLSSALEDIARRAGVPVELSVAAPRLPERIEAAVYFVSSEALANVGKHARATAARIAVRRRGESLIVEVADDGAGGASFESGSGLRGLADRVEALGGTLVVDSPRGHGTRLRARLPLS